MQRETQTSGAEALLLYESFVQGPEGPCSLQLKTPTQDCLLPRFQEQDSLAGPAPDGAVFVIRGGVFAIGLICEDGMVGDGVGAGAGDLAEEEAAETAMVFKLGFLLVVGVEEIEMAGAVLKVLGNVLEQAAQDGFAKGVEKEEQARAGGERKVDRIAAMDPRGRMDSVERAPMLQIAARDAGQSRIQLYARHSMERHLGGEQDGTSHACTDINECEVADGSDWFGSPPLVEKGAKDGGGDAIISGGVAVVAMAALEVTAGDEAAGAHSVGCVKGVTGEAVCNSESGQEAAVVFDGHAWTVAYGDSRFPTHSQRTRMDGHGDLRGRGGMKNKRRCRAL